MLFKRLFDIRAVNINNKSVVWARASGGGRSRQVSATRTANSPPPLGAEQTVATVADWTLSADRCVVKINGRPPSMLLATVLPFCCCCTDSRVPMLLRLRSLLVAFDTFANLWASLKLHLNYFMTNVGQKCLIDNLLLRFESTVRLLAGVHS